MDVSPIAAIRPVAAVRPARVAPDLSRVFEVEYLGQEGDEGYSGPEGEPARGMEDEEGDSGGCLEGEADGAREVSGGGSVNWFA